MKQTMILSAALLALSACGTMTPSTKDKPAASKAPTTYRYYSQTVPVSSKGSYDKLDTTRYSKMHLVQSSYLFR